MAFPCNQFGGAEPGKPPDIRKFADKMDAKFCIMEKINANPPLEHAVYTFLKQGGPKVSWNFHSKFLVVCGAERCTISRFDGVMPKALTADIDDALAQLRE